MEYKPLISINRRKTPVKPLGITFFIKEVSDTARIYKHIFLSLKRQTLQIFVHRLK